MEFGGVGRSRDRVTVIAGSLRAATAVKLSRLKEEAWGISRAAVAKEAMVFFLFCFCVPELQGAFDKRESAAREAERGQYMYSFRLLCFRSPRVPSSLSGSERRKQYKTKTEKKQKEEEEEDQGKPDAAAQEAVMIGQR